MIVDPATGTESLSDIPAWIPGECLYSICARIDDAHGFRKEDTSIALFGKPRTYRTRSLPSALSRFTSVTKGLLGSPEQIMRERTSASIYLPFLPLEHRRRVLAAASATDGPSVFAVLGLSATRLGSQCELRHCIDCHREGLDQHGESVRLIDQQLPCAWYCERHARTLFVQPHRGVGYALPDDGEGLIYPSIALPAPRDRREQQALALCSALARGIKSMPSIDVQALTVDCLHRLEDIGVCSARRLNAAALDQWFAASPIGQWRARAGFQRLPAGWIAKMLRSKLSANPLTWILLWCAIWEDSGQDRALDAFECIATGKLAHSRPTPYGLPSLEPLSWQAFPTATQFFDHQLAHRLAAGMSTTEVAAATGRPLEDIERIFHASPEIRAKALRVHRRTRFADARERIELLLVNRPNIKLDELQQALPDETRFVHVHRGTYWLKVLQRLGVAPERNLRLFGEGT